MQNHEEDIVSLTSVLGKRKVHAIEETSANKTVPPPRKPHDLRLKSVERYENLFTDFFTPPQNKAGSVKSARHLLQERKAIAHLLKHLDYLQTTRLSDQTTISVQIDIKLL